ncbi:PREDICTED: proto-oncogene Mas-like, partial [Eurypyga helias]|uniref:proto-oncogene Mas-like n=1 Tax=Eurypyga helias TaxID=54383 RepID=UPI0005288F59
MFTCISQLSGRREMDGSAAELNGVEVNLAAASLPRSASTASLASAAGITSSVSTVSITSRCVSILCPLWYRCHRPQHLSAVLCALLWALSITVIAAVTSLCLWHEDEHCRVALISMYVLNFLVFAPPMVISSTIPFIKVQCGSQQHQPKRLHIVIFLTVLFFLLFALPLSIWNFLQQFSYIFVSSQVFFLLACINSSVNPFIYFLVGSCRR